MRSLLLLVVCLSSVALAQEDDLTPPPLPRSADVEAAPDAPTDAPQPLNRKRDTGRYKYEPERGVPQGYQLITEPRWALVAAGSAMFAGGTLFTVMFGAAMSEPVHFIPIVGPIISAVRSWEWAGSSAGRGLAAFFYTWLTVVEAGVQAAGITCIIIAFASPGHWLEKEKPPRVSVAPLISSTFTGLSVSGSF
jgi:hypothetical protein